MSRRDVVIDHADVVIIGGGATGIGLLWDLSLRGLDVILLEQAGLAAGTSGAFHGLLHSGMRYAGTDRRTAAECLEENALLKKVAGPFVKDTGGVFCRLDDDDPGWERRWLDGCREVGLRPKPFARNSLLSAEPSLSARIVSAYAVPDAAIDGFGLLWSLVWSSAAAGARVYFRARVTGFLTDDAGVRGVTVVGLGGTEEEALQSAPAFPAGTPGPAPEPGAAFGEVTAPVVVNATGPWARETAALAGSAAASAVPVEQDKGVMLVFNARLVSRVVNRLRPPADGDIFVPHGPVTILGTSSGLVRGDERPAATPEEVCLVFEQGQALVPGLGLAAPLRAYAGVRPLLRACGSGGEPGRRGGRGFLLVDHGEAGGAAGLVTVAGGKFTTFRAMAQAAGDLVCRLLGKNVPGRTAEVGIPRLRRHPAGTRYAGEPAAGGRGRTGSERDSSRARPARLDGALACDCELVDLAHAMSLLDEGLGLADLRRLLRVGMGGCQGVFCSPRLAGVLWQAGWPGSRQRPRPDGPAILAETASFEQARMAGMKSTQWGAQARLAALAEAFDELTLGEDSRAGPHAGVTKQ